MKLSSPPGADPAPTNRTSARPLRLLAVTASSLAVAGSLAAPAFAAGGVTLTPATGGTIMTADNAGATYTTLGDITVQESTQGDVSTGRFQLNAPTGFEFSTTTVTVKMTATGQASMGNAGTCGSGNGSTLSVIPTAGQISFNVCSIGNHATKFVLQAIKVRPAQSTPLPAAGSHIYLDGTAGAATVSGVTAGTSGTTGTSFGDLTEKAGATTQFGATFPAGVTAGVSQSMTVTAKDAAGNTTPGYTGTVHFTSTDPAAVLPANYQFTAGTGNDNGAHTFTGVTLKTAGARSVTATDTVSGSVTGVASTTVSAAAASTMTLTGIATPLTAGASASGTVTLRDAFSNVAAGYTGTVHFTSTDGSATLPGDFAFTAANAGAHSFTGIVLRTAGNQGVSATDGTRSATQSPITVQPGGLDHLVLSPASATITAGSSQSYTAQGRDSSNNSLGDVTSGTTFAVAPNGSCAAASCTATLAGAHSVTGTKGTATGTASLQVNPGAAQVTVSLSAASLVANGSSTSTVQIHVADQYGNARSIDTVTVATDGNAALSSVQNNGGGNYRATLTSSTTAGTQTVTATDGAASGGAVLTQVAGPASQITLTLSPSTIESDGTSTSGATMTVTDAHGNPRAGDTVALVTNGDVSISSVANAGFGTYTATVTASTTGGTETLTAADGSASATAALVELTPVTATGVSPASRGQGANGGAFGQSVTVTGTGFTPGTLTDFGPGVTVKFTTYVSSAQLTAHIVVDPGASVGVRTVTTTLADGRSADCVDCFTVTAGPTVSDITPGEIGPGAQKIVTITGSNFAAGVKVTLPGAGVAVTSVVLADSSHLTVGLSTAFAAAAGPRVVVVTNTTDAGSTSCSGCLTVTLAPAVVEVSPSALGGGAQRTVTVTGANLVDGVKLSFAGTGVAVLSQAYVDDSHVTATLSIAAAAPAGGRMVTLTNPDGGKGSCSTCFSVNAAPVITGMTPGSLARGGTAQATISGANFEAGATVSLSTGVTLSDVTVVDASTITATISISQATGAGNRTAIVTNPDSGKGSCTTCFRVL